MELTNLLQGFVQALTPINIVACFLGAFLGTVTGVLPGIGPAAAMALLLPITFGLPPTTSLIMLAGIYYGAMYGGSTTSILLNMPGETASMVTCFDGYQMAKKGRAGAALAVAAIGSWIAGTVSLIGLMLFAPALANVALAFGPPEYFALILLGVLTLNNLTGDSFLKATLMLIIGLGIATVGTEIIKGISRFDFGNPDLLDGFDVIPVLMGLFGLSEVFVGLRDKDSTAEVTKVRFRDLYPTREEIMRSIAPIFRGTAIGFPIGLLPGPAHILSTMVSYRVEKGVAKNPDRFGKGAIEGVAGPESANNAASTGAMVPLFALGLPFTVQAAIMIAALRTHNITPSPLLISQHGDMFWAVIASMYIGNVVLLILNL
ncbi:MAG: tripartite tricarboxylate transporter permease, partial [Chloroflexota bacterium]